jgi:predicted RNA-binding Zn-ribbon protein involved in translation (DUF1610 family)
VLRGLAAAARLAIVPPPPCGASIRIGIFPMDEEALYQLACVERRCPKCGGATRFVDKDTMSGRDLREYDCKACGWNHVFDVGLAMWKILSDADKSEPGG